MRFTVVLFVLLSSLAIGCTGDKPAPTKPKPTPKNGNGSGHATKKPEKPKPKMPRAKMKNPAARAKIGDWVLLHITMPWGKKMSRWEVTGSSEDQIEIGIKYMDPATKSPTGETDTRVINLHDEEEKYVSPKTLDAAEFTTKDVTIGGKKLNVIVVSRTMGDAENTAWYAVDDLPLNEGIVRSEFQGNVIEVIDFGFGK